MQWPGSCELAELARCRSQLIERLRDLQSDPPTVLWQMHALRGALKKLNTKQFFELADLRGDGARRDTELIGRDRKAAETSSRLEDTQGLQGRQRRAPRGGGPVPTAIFFVVCV